MLGCFFFSSSQACEQQAAALQQLQLLTEDTLDDLAAGLTSHFLPGATLSTDEVGDGCRSSIIRPWQHMRGSQACYSADMHSPNC
jgi:hypothetical protein